METSLSHSPYFSPSAKVQDKEFDPSHMCNKQNNDKKYVFVCVCMYVRVYDMRKYIHNIQIFVLIFLISEFSVVCLFDSLG